MFRLVASMAVGVVALACGQSAAPTAVPTIGPLLQSTAIEYPEVTVSGDEFSMSYPCSYMLHTFYRSAVADRDEALLTLKEELDGYIPKQFREAPKGTPVHGPDILESMHSKERLIDLLMECHWLKEQGDEEDQSMEEWRRAEAKRMEDINRQLREYDPLQHYTPSPQQ